MAMYIPGSEAFVSRPIDPATFPAELPDSLKLHTVGDEQIDALDPLTYEVVRHRLWSVTDEMGETLKRMSGSPIVTDANDFDFAIGDELGQEVQVGLYNTMLAGAVDLAIYWTLKNLEVREGDMFLCNDPWVGGGLHQNDVIVFQPIFSGGELFAWTSAVCHEPDLGGVGLGSFSPAAEDVFSESVPTPPIRIVRRFELQEDVANVWVRRSRVPLLVGLDLRAKVGANTIGRNRLQAVVDQYGADTVKAVMKRMMNDAESRVRDKLRKAPDGTWSATGYQDQSHEGDRGVHKITLKMTKTDGHLTFDFTGTDPQAGVINCTYAGMRGGAMLAMLPILAKDIPWSAGGIMRCFDIISEEGTINNATFPAAVGRGPIGPAWLTGSLIGECLSQMLDRTVELGDSVQAASCGTHDTAVLAGLDQRGGAENPFINIVMDVMAAGYGARPNADGMDTGGLNCIPMGRIPDVEMTEYLYPLMTLWRREEPDTGGPGRRRGGVSGSSAMIPYGTGVPMGLVVASSGKGVAQNNGLSGGYPGNTALGVVVRGTTAKEAFAAGRLPTRLEDLGGDTEIRACYESSFLTPDDVFYMNWQGGGGYGDPVLRDPSDVVRDYHAGKVTLDGAQEQYGVVICGDNVDEAATSATRQKIREARRAAGGEVPESGPKLDLSQAARLDDNLVEVSGADGVVIGCRHCGRRLGTDREDLLALAKVDEPAAAVGPQLTSAPDNYVDDDVVFRQMFCPGCWTAVYSGLVPASHPDHALDIGRLLPASGAHR